MATARFAEDARNGLQLQNGYKSEKLGESDGEGGSRTEHQQRKRRHWTNGLSNQQRSNDLQLQMRNASILRKTKKRETSTY